MRRQRTRLRRLYTLSMLVLGQPQRPAWIAGAVLLAAGAALHALASGYLTKREALATAGPYRFLRNPFYLADFLRDLGVLFACHASGQGLARFVWLVPLLYFPAMYLGLIRRRVVLKEEPLLRARFGALYDAYAAAVPRFLPRLTPAPALTPGRFELESLRRNHESRRISARLGLIVVCWLRWQLFEALTR